MAIYMKFGDVNGDVTTDGFKQWIELNSFQFGVSRGVSSGAAAPRAKARLRASARSLLTKYLDSSSPKLYQDSLAGAFDTKVTIKMTSTTKNKVETFLTYELTDCGLSSYSESSGGDAPVESLSLNFVKIMMTPTAARQVGPDQEG